MMLRVKERGVTLIALIVSIIILIILAAVSIAYALNTDLIKIAIEGTQKYTTKQNDEYSQMNDTEEFLQKALNNIQNPPEDEKDDENPPEVSESAKLGYITDGLILHYDAINNTGTGHDSLTGIWKDLSGNNNDGTLNGCTWGEDYLGLDGVDDGIQIGNKLQELFKDDNTIEISVSFSEGNTRDIIIGNYSTSNAINYEKDTGNRIRVYFDYGRTDKYSDTNILDIGGHQVLSYVMDKNNNTISVTKNNNKVFEVIDSKINAYNYDWTNVWIGRDSRTGTTCLKGKITSVRVYNRKLSSEEVKMNYENDKLRFNSLSFSENSYVTDGLILHYDAINNTGTGHDSLAKVWKDISGNNNDGTLNGCTWGEGYLELNGSSDGVQIENMLQDLFKNDNTIEITVLFSEGNARDIIIGNYSKNYNINYEKFTSEQLRVWFNNGSVNKYSDSNMIDIGKYQLLSYVMDKNNNKISTIRNSNKVFEVIDSQINNYNYDWTNVWIGRDNRTGSTCLKGRIASVRVYNRKLTDEEIERNYNIDRERFKF